MSLANVERTIYLDIYDHNLTPTTIKTVQLDNSVRSVTAMIRNSNQRYDIGQSADVVLTVQRPDKTKVQITGSTYAYAIHADDGTEGTAYGVRAELTQLALAIKGSIKGQFKITSGDQVLRTEIFTINNGDALDADDGDWAGVVDGHNLDEMAEQINTLEADSSVLMAGYEDTHSDTEYYVTKWTQGTIGASNGANSNSTTRCRADGYFSNNVLGYGTAIITIANGFRIAARVWDETMTYKGAYPSDWASGQLELPVSIGYSYRFVISKSNNGSISPSDIPSDAIKVQFTSMSGAVYKAKCAAYNSPYNGRTSTILAAKTFSHADGTHPTIDWYLIADYAGDLYISKDLKSRTYITTRVDWNQYKYAVRGNGDIIAVYRTEFLTAGSTYDSSLDNSRQNPLVCLASEGYSEWHEVDFGTATKPCGWVENSGVCLLPNGDLLFAEYTRMMVNWSSNLWRIEASADVTQATSWEVLKSFRVAENDTDTYDESVIEHFHVVQVDPYTGTVYFSTGDKGNKSQIWYSTDSGDTWTKQTLDGQTSGEELFRLVNFSFTPNKVYWVSDDPENHVVISCDRATAGLDSTSVQVLATMPVLTGRPATYGQVLLEDLGLIVMLDRLDGNASEMPFRAYDLEDGTVKTICTVKSATGADVHVGFRTEYTEFDPEDGVIKMGFGNNSNYLNRNGICGNPAKTFAENINNLSVRISMDSDRNVYARFGTFYI